MSDENLFIGAFDDKDELIIKRAENGGFIVFCRGSDTRIEHRSVGAFTKAQDLILALENSLQGSTTPKGLPHD